MRYSWILAELLPCLSVFSFIAKYMEGNQNLFMNKSVSTFFPFSLAASHEGQMAWF